MDLGFSYFVVADTENHRVVKWTPGAEEGVVVAGGNGEGDGLNQLSVPCGVSLDKDGSVVVVDCGNARVMRWAPGASEGVLVAGGNDEGDALNQLSVPCGGCITQDGSVVVADCGNHRLVKWPKGAKEGIIVAGGNGQGCSLAQMDSPNGVCPGPKAGSLIVCDLGNHRVLEWEEGGKEGKVIAGGTGPGHELTHVDGPCGVCLMPDGSVMVSERGGTTKDYRVTRWVPGIKESSLVAGGQGRGKGLEQLEMPWGVEKTQNGGLVIVDCFNHRVVHWASGAAEGTVVAGGRRGAGLDCLKQPCGVAVAF